ncbi:MAG TPA: efflux RND transporter permease subunit [Acetobacteraceae bacterium]|nr:efflux RND transporter permease subunit [Acetobacteraceae bacterium]
MTFAFLPADIISQIVNFGLPSPIDIQIVGNDVAANRTLAQSLLQRLHSVEGLVDTRIQQPNDAPSLNIDVDRTRAIQAGYQQKDISQDLLIAVSGSTQTSPNFWLNPKNGVSYLLATQTPQYQIDSLQALRNIPLANGSETSNTQTQILGSLGTVSRAAQDAVVSHYNVQTVIDIFGSAQGRDLGGVASDINRIVDGAKKELAPGSRIVIRGQVATMQSSFTGLLSGIVIAIVLVYLLMVVNFQSWIDPFIIITGLPGALAGVVWMLFVTGTTLSVPALTGTMMVIGIATANSILVVSFARDRLTAGSAPMQAALEAGVSRFRPVLMTALAMLIGMLPMALGMGDGGEENAPLGRAVIGGLMIGTLATLIFVPVVFGTVHAWLKKRPVSPNPFSSPVPQASH